MIDCFDLDDLIDQGVHLFERISALLSIEWRLAENTDLDVFDKRLEHLLQKWVETTVRVLVLLESVRHNDSPRRIDTLKVETLRDYLEAGKNQIEERLVARELAQLTPSNDDLLSLAKMSPPSDDWYTEDALTPSDSDRTR